MKKLDKLAFADFEELSTVEESQILGGGGKSFGWFLGLFGGVSGAGISLDYGSSSGWGLSGYTGNQLGLSGGLSYNSLSVEAKTSTDYWDTILSYKLNNLTLSLSGGSSGYGASVELGNHKFSLTGSSSSGGGTAAFLTYTGTF